MARSMILLAALLVLAGCGGGSSQIVVEGTVTLDNTPVADGDISFVPENQTLRTEAGKIQAGAYRLKAPPGKYKVEIRAMREIPGKKGPMGTEAVFEPIIPPAYNEQSKLTADVSPDQKSFNFSLKSKP